MLIAMGTHREAAAMTRLRIESGMTQAQLASAMGLSQTAISKREAGKTEIDEEFGQRLLAVLKKSPDEWARALQASTALAPRVLRDDIPLFDSIAAAGRYMFVADCEQPQNVQKVDRGTAKHPCAYAVPVHGDSMAPTLLDGDTIICEPIIDEHDEYRLVDGRIVVVFAPDALDAVIGDIDNQTRQRKARAMLVPKAGAVGRWRWTEGRAAIIEKDNPKAVPMHLPAEHVTTLRIAVVIELRRKTL